MKKLTKILIGIGVLIFLWIQIYFYGQVSTSVEKMESSMEESIRKQFEELENQIYSLKEELAEQQKQEESMLSWKNVNWNYTEKGLEMEIHLLPKVIQEDTNVFLIVNGQREEAEKRESGYYKVVLLPYDLQVEVFVEILAKGIKETEFLGKYNMEEQFGIELKSHFTEQRQLELALWNTLNSKVVTPEDMEFIIKKDGLEYVIWKAEEVATTNAKGETWFIPMNLEDYEEGNYQLYISFSQGALQYYGEIWQWEIYKDGHYVTNTTQTKIFPNILH